MIPVTSFRGKKVALFGLGGSGLVTARALVAGGADVVAFDDNPDSVAKAQAEGIKTADLRTIDWSSFSSFVRLCRPRATEKMSKSSQSTHLSCTSAIPAARPPNAPTK